MADTPRDVIVPFAIESRLVATVGTNKPRIDDPTYWYLQVAGRLKPGATFEQVKGNLTGPFEEAARNGMSSYMAGLTDTERKLSRNQREGSSVPQLLVLSGSRGIYDSIAPQPVPRLFSASSSSCCC